MDKKQVSFRIEPRVIKRLKYLALEKDKTLTDLFVEAINDLFVKYKRENNEVAQQKELFDKE